MAAKVLPRDVSQKCSGGKSGRCRGSVPFGSETPVAWFLFASVMSPPVYAIDRTCQVRKQLGRQERSDTEVNGKRVESYQKRRPVCADSYDEAVDQATFCTLPERIQEVHTRILRLAP